MNGNVLRKLDKFRFFVKSLANGEYNIVDDGIIDDGPIVDSVSGKSLGHITIIKKNGEIITEVSIRKRPASKTIKIGN